MKENRDAILSEDGKYRYVLFRKISHTIRWVKPCLFVMLNPSTADANQDDRTIRRCLGFAESWGCTSLTVVNLFAYRATNPKDLEKIRDPVGVDNSYHLEDQMRAHKTGKRIVAWGAHEMARDQFSKVSHLFDAVEALAVTLYGWPKHPLYLPKKSVPTIWKPPTKKEINKTLRGKFRGTTST